MKPHDMEPVVDGQCGEVLQILKRRGTIMAMELPFLGIPQYNARVHDLQEMGFNIVTTMESNVLLHGRVRETAERLTLGSPIWIDPDER